MADRTIDLDKLDLWSAPIPAYCVENLRHWLEEQAGVETAKKSYPLIEEDPTFIPGLVTERGE